MNNWETMQTKRIIFDLFDYVRILWNDFYRLDRDFNDDDLKRIEKLIELVEHDTKEIKEMIENVL